MKLAIPAIVALAQLLSCGGDDGIKCENNNCTLPGRTTVKWIFNAYPQLGFADDSCNDTGTVMVHVDVTNTSGLTAAFHAEAMTLRLQTDARPGEDLAPVWTPPEPITLQPGTARTFDWDLAQLFPGAFAKPGNYWLTLDAPAAMGLHQIAIAVR